MNNIIDQMRPKGRVEPSLRPRPPFNARPVCAAGRESRSTEGPYSTHYTATASFLYINRIGGTDRFGKVPDGYVDRGDLLAAGRCHPQQNMPALLKSGDLLWRVADEMAAREGPKAVSATHIVADLPPTDDVARWTWMVEQYAYRHLVGLGMIVDYAIHLRRDARGGVIGAPHVHMLATARFWRANGRHGGPHWRWLANKDQTRAAEDAWLQLIGLRSTVVA